MLAQGTKGAFCPVAKLQSESRVASNLRPKGSSPLFTPHAANQGGSRLTMARRANDGIVIVDHGSRRSESNAMLEEFVEMYRQKTGHPIVEAAHMELASPTIEDAFDRCVEQGAQRVIISPYFLFPGRHWNKDIPALAAAASEKHPGIRYLVTAPIGLHEAMVKVLEDRMNHCLSQVDGKAEECEMCAGTGRCREMGEQTAAENETQKCSTSP